MRAHLIENNLITVHFLLFPQPILFGPILSGHVVLLDLEHKRILTTIHISLFIHSYSWLLILVPVMGQTLKNLINNKKYASRPHMIFHYIHHIDI